MCFGAFIVPGRAKGALMAALRTFESFDIATEYATSFKEENSKGASQYKCRH